MRRPFIIHEHFFEIPSRTSTHRKSTARKSNFPRFSFDTSRECSCLRKRSNVCTNYTTMLASILFMSGWGGNRFEREKVNAVIIFNVDAERELMDFLASEKTFGNWFSPSAGANINGGCMGKSMGFQFSGPRACVMHESGQGCESEVWKIDVSRRYTIRRLECIEIRSRVLFLSFSYFLRSRFWWTPFTTLFDDENAIFRGTGGYSSKN